MQKLLHCALALTLIAIAHLETVAQENLRQDRDPDGRLATTRYTVAGTTHFIQYHENGRIREKGAYRRGAPEGVWKQFDPNGTMIAMARFQNGKRVGTTELHDPMAYTTRRLHYGNGALLRAEEIAASGEPIAYRDYR